MKFATTSNARPASAPATACSSRTSVAITSTRGGKSAWKQFHDAFTSYGGPPIPLVRKAMMGGNGKAVF